MGDYFVIRSVRLSVDAKEITDSGSGTTSGTATHAVVPFTKPFAAITSIIVTPKVTTAGQYSMGVRFDETIPNPLSFEAFAYDATGALVAVDFFWTVRGVQGAV